MQNIIKDKISFVGLGKLGLPLSTTFAKNGVNVVGIDTQQTLVDKLNNGELPFFEEGLEENLKLSRDNIEYKSSYDGIVTDTDITIILVNTQIGKTYSSVNVKYVIEDICNELKDSDKPYHLFILSSTVMPGDTQDIFIPMIEKLTNRKLNEGFGFSYVPDIVKLGSVIKDFENPDVVMIGSSDDYSGEITRELYENIPTNNPPILQMSLLETEISKFSLNAYLVTKISFANFLSNLCETVDGVNVDNVTNAIGYHKPIGHYFLKGGLSFGGTCFPRDTSAFIELSEKFGLDAKQLKATDEINKYQHSNLLNIVKNQQKNSISVLGLSFKPNTPVIIESPSIKLIESLLLEGKTVNVYDPLCIDEIKETFGDKLNYFNSVKDCFEVGELVIIALPYDEFKDIDDTWKSFDDQVILDCWRVLDKDKFNNISYKCLGRKN